MTREKVTSVDVAMRAGVSQSAVSRVFTPGASASAKTVEKVRRAAAELGYRPNVLARSLITGRSRMIGLIVTYIDNQFYPDALQRLSIAFQARGYHMLVFSSPRCRDEIEHVLEEVLDYQVAGIIAASVRFSDKVAGRCADAKVPVVLFNRGQHDERLAQVTSDNFNGAKEIARFLVASGHRRIAQITGLADTMTSHDRERGFIAGLAECGRTLAGSGRGNYSREDAIEATRRLCAASTPPDAIFAGNDHMAFGVIDTLRHELGLRVPEDVAVVGYDDVAMAAWSSYDLTTWRQPLDRMVEHTVDLLLRRISLPETEPVKLALAGDLICRGTTRGTSARDSRPVDGAQ